MDFKVLISCLFTNIIISTETVITPLCSVGRTTIIMKKNFDNKYFERILKEKNMTPRSFAKKINYETRYVQRWLKGEHSPREEHLSAIAEGLGIEKSELFTDSSSNPVLNSSDRLFDENDLKKTIETTINVLHLENTSKSLQILYEFSNNSFREGTRNEVPSIIHPLTMCRSALSLKLYQDNILSVILLHEIFRKAPDPNTIKHFPLYKSLPEEIKKNIDLLTMDDSQSTKKKYREQYHENIRNSGSRIACLVKGFDRADNMSTITSTGHFNHDYLERIMIKETNDHIIPILEEAAKCPTYVDAVFNLQYQIRGMVEIIKTLLRRINEQ